MDRELRWWFTLGHTPLINDGFSEATLSTLGHTPLIDDNSLWDDPTLGHNHFRGRFYWRYSHSTRYSALGHTLLIDGWFLRWRFIWGVALSLVMDFDCSLEHSHFSYFTLGHSQDGEHFSSEHSHPIWILYTRACPSFGGRSYWFLTLEHPTSDMEIIGLFHVVNLEHQKTHIYWCV